MCGCEGGGGKSDSVSQQARSDLLPRKGGGGWMSLLVIEAKTKYPTI